MHLYKGMCLSSWHIYICIFSVSLEECHSLILNIQIFLQLCIQLWLRTCICSWAFSNFFLVSVSEELISWAIVFFFFLSCMWQKLNFRQGLLFENDYSKSRRKIFGATCSMGCIKKKTKDQQPFISVSVLCTLISHFISSTSFGELCNFVSYL